MRLRRKKSIDISYSTAIVLALLVVSVVMWAYLIGTIAALDRC